MAYTAPLTTSAQLRDQFRNDWLPTIGWVRQGNGWSTSIAFAPSMVTNASDRFDMEIRFFRDAEYIGSYRTGTVESPQILRVNMADALKALKLESYDGITEVYVRGEGLWSKSRRIKGIFDVWMEIRHDNGQFRVVGPTGQFAGSGRVRVPTQFAYESYPGVPIGTPFSTDLLLMNPYTIPIWYEVAAYNRAGKALISNKCIIRKRFYDITPLESLMPNLLGHASPDPFVSISIKSRYKLVAFCLFKNTNTGEVTALDHTWPFLDFSREN